MLSAHSSNHGLASENRIDIAFPDPSEDTELLQEKRRAGAALRRIIDGIIMKEASPGHAAALAEELENLANRLDALPDKPPRTSFGHRISPDDVRDFIAFSPLTGRANPIAPPLDIWADPAQKNRALGRVLFGRGYEGAPGVVHGGHVAAIFDELLGFVQGFSDRPGMTGTLTITYRAPTPLLTELRLEGDYEGCERRKILTSGRLYAGELLLAEARGVFIMLTDEQYALVAAMQNGNEAGR